MEESSALLERRLASESPSPGEQVLRQEQLHQLAHALAQLPEDQRQAVELWHLHGQTLTEIAGHMNRTKGAVGKLLFRAMEKLRDLLSDPS